MAIAQSHGVTIGGGCRQSPTATCSDDAACDDGIFCTVDDCPDLPHTTSCHFRLVNADGFGDSFVVTDASAVVHAASGDVVIPAGSNIPGPGDDLPIASVGGNTDCVVGGSLPCKICAAGRVGACGAHPPDVDLPGFVVFREDTYVPEANEPGPVRETVSANMRDVCDAPSVDCSTDLIVLAWSPSGPLQGCTTHRPMEDSTPCPDIDNNECTIAGCDGTGNPTSCDQNHVLPDSTPCGGGSKDSECARAGCNGAGVCDPLHVLFADATPCADTDGTDCTAAGCNGAGLCDQALSIAIPDEVSGVDLAADKRTISWSSMPSASGYDLVRGDLTALPVGPGGGDELCEGHLLSPSTMDPDVPAAGHGFWYLARADNACGSGTYGVTSSGSSHTTATCP